MSTRSPDLIPLAELPTYWQGRANALRLLDQQRTSSNVATLDTAATYETCANELRASIRKAAVPDADINLFEVAHRLDRAMEDETISCLQAAKEMSAALRKAAALEGQTTAPVAWRWRSLLGPGPDEAHAWSYSTEKPNPHPQYLTEPLYTLGTQSSPIVPDQHAGADVSDGDELLPCPFCGSGAKPETGRYGFKSIVCTTCCAETAPATSDEQASTWWNRRSIQSQATDAPAEGTSVGEITWHSSEDGGGPDVGISLYLGPNDRLYAGEISSDLFRRCGGEEFYPSDGGWFLVRLAEETSIIASIGDRFSGRDFLEQLAQWARASAPKPAPAVDREALINAIKSKIHANKGFEFPVIEGIDEAADAIFELLPATPDQTTEGQP